MVHIAVGNVMSLKNLLLLMFVSWISSFAVAFPVIGYAEENEEEKAHVILPSYPEDDVSKTISSCLDYYSWEDRFYIPDSMVSKMRQKYAPDSKGIVKEESMKMTRAIFIVNHYGREILFCLKAADTVLDPKYSTVNAFDNKVVKAMMDDFFTVYTKNLLYIGSSKHFLGKKRREAKFDSEFGANSKVDALLSYFTLHKNFKRTIRPDILKKFLRWYKSWMNSEYTRLLKLAKKIIPGTHNSELKEDREELGLIHLKTLCRHTRIILGEHTPPDHGLTLRQANSLNCK